MMKLIIKKTIEKTRLLGVISILLGAFVFTGSVVNAAGTSSPADKASETATLDIYKSKTCGCCEKWVEHMEGAGFQTRLHHPTDLRLVKKDNHIPSGYQACHTAVSEKGYVFEGHIPARIVQQFLANPPENAIGLIVPGMPLGSPGMEMDNRFMPHDVFLLKKDGSTEVYMHIKDAEN